MKKQIFQINDWSHLSSFVLVDRSHFFHSIKLASCPHNEQHKHYLTYLAHQRNIDGASQLKLFGYEQYSVLNDVLRVSAHFCRIKDNLGPKVLNYSF